MTEILEKVKRKIEQLNHRIETRRGVNYYDESKRLLILEERLGVYEDLLPDFASLITTIESQKEALKGAADISHIAGSKIKELESTVKSQKEEIESQRQWQSSLLSDKEVELIDRNLEIKSLKAITELAVKGLERIAEHDKEIGCYTSVAMVALSEIERLSQ